MQKFYVMAYEFYKAEKFEEAIEILNLISNLTPDGHNLRGMLNAKMGNLEEAIQDCDIAIKLDPNNDNYYFKRACLKAEMNEHEDAIIDVTTAINIASEKNIKKGEYYNIRGISQVELGLNSEAIKDFKSAILIDKNNQCYRKNLRNLRIKIEQQVERIQNEKIVEHVQNELKHKEILNIENQSISS